MSGGELRLRANAKLNLSLDVVGVRQDGYHLMDMVNQSVSLCDELVFTPYDGEFRVRSSLSFLPTGEKNLVWKAAARLCEEAGAELPHISVYVKKRIPTQAGLGGGSADAAATLIALNSLCGFGFDTERLLKVAEKVGADVPFCLIGGSARVTGVGEVIEPFTCKSKYTMLLAMPRSGNSTKEIFERLDSCTDLTRPNTDAVIASLQRGDSAAAAFSGARNVFQAVAADENTYLLIDLMSEAGAVHCSLTGTGACVFSVFSVYKDAVSCRDTLRAKGYGAWVVRPTPCGAEILKNKE